MHGWRGPQPQQEGLGCLSEGWMQWEGRGSAGRGGEEERKQTLPNSSAAHLGECSVHIRLRAPSLGHRYASMQDTRCCLVFSSFPCLSPCPFPIPHPSSPARQGCGNSWMSLATPAGVLPHVILAVSLNDNSPVCAES